MDRLDSLLPQVLRKRGLYEEAQASLLLHATLQWLKEHCSFDPLPYHPKRFKDGVLCISADHSIALQEGQSMTTELLRHLNVKLGMKILRIEFTRSA